MVRSPMTLDDRNYWDGLHYNTEIADRIVDLMADAVAGRPSMDGTYILVSASHGDDAPAPPIR